MKTYCRQEISRGDIYYADLRPVIGSEQGGIRPVLILQNNVGNRHSDRSPHHQQDGKTAAAYTCLFE